MGCLDAKRQQDMAIREFEEKDSMRTFCNDDEEINDMTLQNQREGTFLVKGHRYTCESFKKLFED